jgi:hypothetical protein|uniref:Pathogenesis-related protein 5 n=4 Tax=Zea mays TaxID=4577 RepID=D9IZY9_MAIZE|nr:pathogenesis-related protein 5 [Zea mays subsp. parviglumis]ABA34038.1 pathogenesis-related protein 5 [Zea mays subsp. parviglumis]ABA34040.1 pathogenesis-related protein 5 [Zea mays subsp. parviglumis]ABA34042.1 pathogenesis-related protein 5 [Zea mays subsp. parviglumis]ADK11106.1 pathogenesis-related protein 5 [Zea mays]
MAAASSSSVLLLLLAAALAGMSANAATFTITNNCGFTVWPAATPVGGGTQLNPGGTWTVNVPAGTSSGRVWGRTGCSFNGNSGSCQTGDCGGALACTLSGQPPLTLAEFTIGGSQDFYDISVIDGYNLAMAFSCSTGVRLVCTDSGCPDAYHHPNDVKTHACGGNSNYQVTFCP